MEKDTEVSWFEVIAAAYKTYKFNSKVSLGAKKTFHCRGSNGRSADYQPVALTTRLPDQTIIFLTINFVLATDNF